MTLSLAGPDGSVWIASAVPKCGAQGPSMINEAPNSPAIELEISPPTEGSENCEVTWISAASMESKKASQTALFDVSLFATETQILQKQRVKKQKNVNCFKVDHRVQRCQLERVAGLLPSINALTLACPNQVRTSNHVHIL